MASTGAGDKETTKHTRMNISVPKCVREMMDRYAVKNDTNWSKVASDAFRGHVAGDPTSPTEALPDGSWE